MTYAREMALELATAGFGAPQPIEHIIALVVERCAQEAEAGVCTFNDEGAKCAHTACAVKRVTSRRIRALAASPAPHPAAATGLREPCPYCKSQPVAKTFNGVDFHAACGNASCNSRDTFMGPSLMDALAEWDRKRATAPQLSVPAERPRAPGPGVAAEPRQSKSLIVHRLDPLSDAVTGCGKSRKHGPRVSAVLADVTCSLCNRSAPAPGVPPASPPTGQGDR